MDETSRGRAWRRKEEVGRSWPRNISVSAWQRGLTIESIGRSSAAWLRAAKFGHQVAHKDFADMPDTRLFTLDGAVRDDPAVKRWFAMPPSELRLMAQSYFEQMRSCGPDVLELLHDGHPTACVGNLAFGYVNAFQSHVNLGFFFGSVLKDPAGLLEGTGRFMRHVKLRPDLHCPERELQELVAVAYMDAKARQAALHPRGAA
jgi:hypothetical protein